MGKEERPEDLLDAFIEDEERGVSILNLEVERERRVQRVFLVAMRYKAGVAVEDIQHEFKCARNTVLRIARMFGLPKRPKAFDPAVRAAAIGMLKDGAKLKEIARLLKVSESYVSIVAREEGISRYKSRKDHTPCGA